MTDFRLTQVWASPCFITAFVFLSSLTIDVVMHGQGRLICICSGVVLAMEVLRFWVTITWSFMVQTLKIRSNFRIPRNSFTCHWIRIAFIVLCLDLQSLPTHVSEADQSCGVFWSLAQNTCRRINRSYCSQPIYTKRCYWAVFLKRIESRTLKTMKALYALYAKYANVLVVKIKFLNLKPNCIYSMQSTEQHYYRETEEQNSNGCIYCLWRKTLCWIHLMLWNEATDNCTNGINFTIRKVNLIFVFIAVVWIFFF